MGTAWLTSLPGRRARKPCLTISFLRAPRKSL
nr:MAG TPA: hypothetical protein [Caudoviricetes sp.]DAT61794.1 MAG TPA: hypothetical protein [Caudoviricetes sp.]